VALNILLLGPQGSGKGTQAKRIVSEYGIPHVATGDMLREAMAEGGVLGELVRPIYESGGLVPDGVMIELIRTRLSRDDARDGFVLDGFPRTMTQAEALDEMLRDIGHELDVVFDFQVADEATVVARMRKRAEEEGRTDDTDEAIRNRLDLYHAETAPLIEHYRSRANNVIGIHADRSIDEVFSEIQQALDQVAIRG
jgi:adenylate kinase